MTSAVITMGLILYIMSDLVFPRSLGCNHLVIRLRPCCIAVLVIVWTADSGSSAHPHLHIGNGHYHSIPNICADGR